MTKDESGDAYYTQDFIRAAQYIVRLTNVQNVLEELGKVLVNYFHAEWVASAGMGKDEEIILTSCTVPDKDFSAKVLTPRTMGNIRDVLGSGFLASDTVAIPEPYAATFLPLTEMNQTTAVMLIAHKIGEPVSPERLDLYLALAGLAGSTMGRISTEQELRRHQGHLEDLVEERTRRLRQSEQRWATTLASIGDAVIATDVAGKITFMNPVAEELTGWTLGEASTKPVTGVLNIVNEHTRQEVENPVAKVLREGMVVGLANHTILVRKDGTEVPIDDSAAPIRDEDGTTMGVVLVFRDITERKRQEEALRKAHDELEGRVKERTEELRGAYEKLKQETEERECAESQLRQAQKMEALGTLSGGIAHDFNNILAAIIGFAELLQGHMAKESRDARHLDRIMEAGIRGRELVRQMLTFCRKTEQEKKPLAVSSIVKETAKLIRSTTPATISIHVNASSDALILGDPTQIQQVLMNLCTNAAYAMRDEGGSLDIELSDHSISPSDGTSPDLNPGRYVRLSVRDTGIGMSSDIMDKIFDPFFTTKGVGEGTGLGLAVVHGIVKQHDGSITVESVPRRGSTFIVYFPRISGGPHAVALHDDEIPTGSERILFVDDEEALVEMGEDILAELGYEVTSRMNGREALALFKLDPSRFDLVITDQTMPEMTGVELAKEILACKPGMPIIICTGFSYVVDADKAKTAGIKAFAMKPLTKREIAKTVREVLDG